MPEPGIKIIDVVAFWRAENPNPDATLTLTRTQVDALLFDAVNDDLQRQRLEKLEAEDERALEVLGQHGSKRERLERAARVKGWIRPNGDPVLSRGGWRRENVVIAYMWKIRFEGKTAPAAADELYPKFGFSSRKAMRSFLERAELEIREDQSAPERPLVLPEGIPLPPD